MAARAESNLVMEPEDRVLVIERVFDAPRDLVWQMFTDPKHLRQWMGPKEYPAELYEADVRPGGKWRGRLRAADGNSTLGQFGEFRTIVKPEWLSYTFQWEKRDAADVTFETLITITFAALGNDKTVMTFHQAVFNTKSNRDGHNYGWNSGFDRLDAYLATLETRHA